MTFRKTAAYRAAVLVLAVLALFAFAACAGIEGGTGQSSVAQTATVEDLPPPPENFSYFGTWRNATNPREAIVVYQDGLAVLQVEGATPVVGSYRASNSRWGTRLRFSLDGMSDTNLIYTTNSMISGDGGLYHYSGSLTPPTGTPAYIR